MRQQRGAGSKDFLGFESRALGRRNFLCQSLRVTQIKFGTDGWRAVIAEDFTFANVARVAQATADYWIANPVAGTERKIIVGYDRRFLSDRFGQIAAEVFAGNNFQVVLTPEPSPTPSGSFAV